MWRLTVGKPVTCMRSLAVLLVVFMPAALRAQPHLEPALSSFVFTDVTVVDVAAGKALPDMSVVVRGNRIAAVGKSDTIGSKEGMRILSATGKFLIPGLWDMHVHTGRQEVFFPLYIANGITGVRDMGGNLDQATGSLSIRFELLRQWREEVEAGKLLGPRMMLAGFMVDGPEPFLPGAIAVGSAEEGRRAVLKLKQLGVDFIKIYSLLPREAYLAIAQTARSENIPFAGHLPEAITPIEASDAGQLSIEHLAAGWYGISSSTREAQLRQRRIDANQAFLNPAADQRSAMQERIRIDVEAAASYSVQREAALFERLARNKTWQVPTLAVLREFPAGGVDDPRNRYLPPFILDQWRSRFPQHDGRKPESPESHPDGAAALVGAMRKAGVPILAGSDSANAYVYPGSGLHEELELLVQAGLSPAEALRAATLSPARFFNFQNKLGTVEPGKLADLVLLDANPLEDIRNTRRIAGVVVNGRYLAKATLQDLLAQAEMAAKNVRRFPREQRNPMAVK